MSRALSDGMSVWCTANVVHSFAFRVVFSFYLMHSFPLYILYKCVSPSHPLSVPLRAFPVTPCFPAPVQKSSLSHEKNPPFCLAFRAKGVLLHPLSARAPRRFGPAAFSPEKSPPDVWRGTGKSLTFASAFPFRGGEEVL